MQTAHGVFRLTVAADGTVNANVNTTPTTLTPPNIIKSVDEYLMAKVE